MPFGRKGKPLNKPLGIPPKVPTYNVCHLGMAVAFHGTGTGRDRRNRPLRVVEDRGWLVTWGGTGRHQKWFASHEEALAFVRAELARMGGKKRKAPKRKAVGA